MELKLSCFICEKRTICKHFSHLFTKTRWSQFINQQKSENLILGFAEQIANSCDYYDQFKEKKEETCKWKLEKLYNNKMFFSRKCERYDFVFILNFSYSLFENKLKCPICNKKIEVIENV